MRKLIVFLACAAILLIALDWITALGMRRIRTGIYGAFNRVAEGTVNADLIITGSSRATLHYDPSPISAATGLSTFNLGRIGSPVIVHHAVLRHYLAHNRAPRLLIENVDLGSLLSSDLYDPVQFVPYLHEPAFRDLLVPRYFDMRKRLYLPLYGYVADDVEFEHYVGLQTFLKLQPGDNCRNGFLIQDRHWSGAFDELKKTRKTLVQNEDSVGIKDMADLLDDARSQGIPVILVFSPMYRGYLDMVSNLPRIKNDLAQMAHGHGALFWDMSYLAPISFSTDYFADSPHLNKLGSKRFSEIIGSRVAAYLGR